mgnify:CR=1 FL=1
MLNALKREDRGLRVAVIGASGGIGLALANRLQTVSNLDKLYILSRKTISSLSSATQWLPLDLLDEASIEGAAKTIAAEGDLDLIIIASGMLHGDTIEPEKDWRELDAQAMTTVFAINTIGPALVFKHFAPLLPRKGQSVIAALSARVGSISDNRLGGWYSYRASKAALNQIIKTFSIELGRKRKEAIILGLHPGTVATDLSQPFQNNSYERFTPDQCAGYLLDVLSNAQREQSGTVLDWQGDPVPA